jgi:tetratricopeptide (TPR) repeat protein
MNDMRSSLRHWERVRELVSELPPAPEVLSRGARACIRIMNLGWQLGISEEEATERFEDGKALAQRAGDIGLLARVNSAYGVMRGLNLGFVDESIARAREAMRLADEVEDPALQSSMRMRLGVALFLAGRHGEASEICERTLMDIPSDDSFTGITPRPALLTIRGLALGLMGRELDQSRACLELSVRLSSDRGYLEMEVFTHGYQALLCTLYGRIQAARRHAAETARLAKTLGSRLSRSYAALSMGRVQLADGKPESATRSMEEFLGNAEESRTSGSLRGSALACLSYALLAQGNVSAAQRRAEQAVAFDRDHGLAWDHFPWLVWARSSTAAGERMTAQRALEEAQRRIGETEARIYQPYLHECCSAFARRFGDVYEPREELREAHRLFVEVGATEHAERVARELIDFDRSLP